MMDGGSRSASDKESIDINFPNLISSYRGFHCNAALGQ